MFKVKSDAVRSGVFIVKFEHISCSSVSIVNFEHVIAGWVITKYVRCYKMWRTLLQSSSNVTKCDCNYKMRRNTDARSKIKVEKKVPRNADFSTFIIFLRYILIITYHLVLPRLYPLFKSWSDRVYIINKTKNIQMSDMVSYL